MLTAIGAALRFDVPEDTQSVELQQLLERANPEDIVDDVMGVQRGEALFEPLVEVVRGAQR